MIKINKYVSYFLGLILLGIGIVLAIKSNYGVTVSTSPAYVLSLKLKSISLGTINYLIQGLVFLLMLVVLRKLKLTYFISFITSIFLGYSIDLFSNLFSGLVVESHIFRVTCFVLSILIIGWGLVFFIKSKQPILPFDMFVREVSSKYGVRIGKFKTCFDISILAISVSLSFIFFGQFKGVHIGTLVSALTIGTAVDIFMRFFDSYFVITGSENSSISL